MCIVYVCHVCVCRNTSVFVYVCVFVNVLLRLCAVHVCGSMFVLMSVFGKAHLCVLCVLVEAHLCVQP